MSIPPLLFLFFILSSTITFFTAALVTHCIVFYFQIKTYRLRYFLYLLPFVSIIFEILPLGYSVSNWLNPLSCLSCAQRIFLNLVSPDLQAYLATHNISLVSYLSQGENSNIIASFVGFLCTVSVLIFFRKLVQIVLSHRHIMSIINNGEACTRRITNLHLKALIDLFKIEILFSKEVNIPMATHVNTIVMPSGIEFSQDEFEIVIAHEAEHVCWKDPQCNLIIYVFSSIFWWIPMKYWIKKVEEEQEMSCDQEVLKQDFSGEFLVSALVKVATYTRGQEAMTVCCLVGKKNAIFKRVDALLEGAYQKEKFTIIGAFVLICGLILSLVCLLK